MPKRNNNNGPKDTMRTTLREMVMMGTAGSPGTTVYAPVTDAIGANDRFFLSPVGLTAATLSASTYADGSTTNVEKPHLRKLYNLALDFRLYRVLSGKLVWVPGCAVTTPGQITMSSSADPFDGVVATAVAYSSGQSYKTFNLSAGKECSIALSVDPSWKKISSVMSCPMGSVFDGSGTAANVVINVASLDDLCFTTIGVNVQGSGSGVTVGTFRMEYEVEFKGLIDAATNA